MKLVYVIVAVALVGGCATRYAATRKPPQKQPPVWVDRAVTPPPAPARTGQTARPGTVPDAGPLEATVYFDFDRYAIRPDQRPALDGAAGAIRVGTETAVVIEGHADERGTIEYNLALGQRRAEAVRRSLEALGVRPGAIWTVSYGEERPADPGHDENSWAKNRRCEIR